MNDSILAGERRYTAKFQEANNRFEFEALLSGYADIIFSVFSLIQIEDLSIERNDDEKC